MTLQYAMKLIDLKNLPNGITPDFFLEGLERMLRQNGEDWIIRHKALLKDSLEYVATL